MAWNTSALPGAMAHASIVPCPESDAAQILLIVTAEESDMASLSREPALAKVLEHEGGYTNHPADPGGPTNFGITIADYRKYVKADARAADVQAMRLGEAKAIYRAAYWDAMRCDELPAGLDYATFDYGVNSGVGRAVRVLQRLLHMADDGRMTDTVIAAVDQRDPGELIAALCDERLAFLKKLKTWPVFGAGWGRRVADVRTVAIGMASQACARRKPGARKSRTRKDAASATG